MTSDSLLKIYRLLLVVLALLLPLVGQAWFDDAWTYKASFVASNGGGTLVDQQVQINLSAANVNPAYIWSPNGDDIRAIAADGVTPLDYYIENWDSFGQNAVIYVRVASLPPGDTTIDIYYGNNAAADASNPTIVLSEVGLRYHTRQSTLDPTSRAQALAEFNSIADGTIGYGCKAVTAFNLISNSNQFPSGSSRDILFFSNNHFEVPPGDTGTWDFRFAGDYGRGGGLYLDSVDSDEKWNEDLWWGANWANTAEILTVSASLGAGFHNLQMIGAEGGNDGGTSVQYRSPATASVWTDWNITNVNIRSEKCSVVTVPAALASPSLTTSTKTVFDLNGGNIEPGDVLRYIITLNETVGTTAEKVSITDDIASEVGSLVIVALPAGASDASDPAAGANSKGLVSVSGITVPANGSVSIIFEVTIDVVPDGTAIDNSATLVNPSGGANVTSNAPTLVANVASPSVSGVKRLYLYDNNDLSRVAPLSDEGDVLIDENGDQEVWTLIPALQSALVIDKTTDMSINLWIRRAGETNWPRRDLRIEVRGSVNGLVGLFENTSPVIIQAGTGFSNFNFPLTQPASPTSLAIGEAITLTIINRSADPIGGGFYNDDIEVNQSGPSGDNTVLNFPSDTVVNVDAFESYDAAFPSGALTTSYSPGETVHFRAIVSDPFGDVDISAANIVITDAGGTPVGPSTAMTVVSPVVPSTGALKVFEYSFNIVGMPAQGNWAATITALEGTEGTISDSEIYSFSVVLPPSLTTVITASVSTANPGTPVTYTLVTVNSGSGDATEVVVTHSLPPFASLRLNTYGAATPFSCSAGCPASGLDLGTPVYSDDNGTSYGYAPVSAAEGASVDHDGRVTNWQIPMTGIMEGSSASFTILFELELD
jgi:uncharacterized repeat protein (TIGR01451 family)